MISVIHEQSLSTYFCDNIYSFNSLSYVNLANIVPIVDENIINKQHKLSKSTILPPSKNVETNISIKKNNAISAVIK